MNKKNFYLIVGILTALVFIGFLSETEPRTLLGFSVNIWFFRIGYLILTIFFFKHYFKLKKAEQTSI